MIETAAAAATAQSIQMPNACRYPDVNLSSSSAKTSPVMAYLREVAYVVCVNGERSSGGDKQEEESERTSASSLALLPLVPRFTPSVEANETGSLKDYGQLNIAMQSLAKKLFIDMD